MKKVVSAKANNDFKLDIEFNDGSFKRFDVKPYLDYPVFRELKDLDYFKNIKIVFGKVRWKMNKILHPKLFIWKAKKLKKSLEFKVSEVN